MITCSSIRNYGLYALAFAGVLRPTYGQGSSGCGSSNQTGGDFTIVSGGTTRQYRLNLPSNYDPNTATGLLLSFHGNSRTNTYQESLTAFSDPSVNPNYIAVYPQGLGNSWQGAPYHSSSYPSDITFTTDLVTYIENNYCIDTTRIYASGQSNGGGFTNTLACSSSGGIFAAFGISCGAFYDDDVDIGATCSPANTPGVPILEFHGLADTTIPYYGPKSSSGPVPAIPDWLSSWAVLNGCSSPVTNVTTQFTGYNYTTFSCGSLSNIVSHYRIFNMPHIWPNTTTSPSPINASPIMISFFGGYTLGSASTANGQVVRGVKVGST